MLRDSPAVDRRRRPASFASGEAGGGVGAAGAARAARPTSRERRRPARVVAVLVGDERPRRGWPGRPPPTAAARRAGAARARRRAARERRRLRRASRCRRCPSRAPGSAGSYASSSRRARAPAAPRLPSTRAASRPWKISAATRRTSSPLTASIARHDLVERRTGGRSRSPGARGGSCARPSSRARACRPPFRWSLARRSSSSGRRLAPQAPDLLERQPHHRGHRVEAGARVDRQDAGVGVGGDARRDRVDEARASRARSGTGART